MKKGALGEMEKRQGIRLEKTLPVRFDLPDIPAASGVFEALSRNIGEGGLFIETDLVQDDTFSLVKDMMLNLEIELLGHARRIKPKGRIAWVSKKSRSPQKKKNGFGIKFVHIENKERRAISLFISKEMIAQTEISEKEIPEILREQKLSDRQRRNLEILDIIRKNRLISRAEISKNSDINIVTVTNYIDAYLKKGLVFERGLDISTGGRRPELIEINPQYGYVLGVDLGPINEQEALMQVVATDFSAQPKARAAEKRGNSNIETSMELLKGLIGEVLASRQVEHRRLRGIGVGISGIMDKFGGTVRNPFSGATFANYVTIKKELEDEFGLPVFIENAAACALFAEKWIGLSLEAKSADNIMYIFSEGQCALMLKGELYTGSSKSAGQLNLACPRNNNSNNADADFCWMDAASDCVLRAKNQDLNKIAQTKEDLTSAGMRMGAKIAYMVNVFNPQVVIVGGCLGELGDIFLDGIRRSVNRWSFRENTNIVRVIPTTMRQEAVAVGAASLVIEAAFLNI
jgi:predicted NBD/HSP70 family sugar kinase/Tfp pilus assembly protein PilZ